MSNGLISSELFDEYDPDIEQLLKEYAKKLNITRRAVIRDIFCEVFCIEMRSKCFATDRFILKEIHRRCEATGNSFEEVTSEILRERLHIPKVVSDAIR